MLELRRLPLTRSRYVADDPRGFEIELVVPGWRRSGAIIDDDLNYEVHLRAGESTLTLEGQLIADAIGRATRWQIASSDDVFVVVQPSWAKRLSSISKDGELIGQLRETSKARGLISCELPLEMHPVIQAYIALIGITGWREVNKLVISGSSAIGGSSG